MTALDPPPLIVAGGSLVARNEKLLLDRYPDLLVARGADESTIQDVLGYWHGDLKRDEIQGIGYTGQAYGADLSPSAARSATPLSCPTGCRPTSCPSWTYST